MVRRIAVLVFSAVALFVLACGGDGDASDASQQADPTARPTRTGPTANVEPRSGPPGSEITVSGASWPPGVSIDVTSVLPAGQRADPYATVTADEDGSFSVRFRLETTSDGKELEVGPFNLLVRSAQNQISLPFLVETRRPIQNQGPGG